jgi:beta-galactosidase
MKKRMTFAFLLLATVTFAQRQETDLSDQDWKITLDPEAAWQYEVLKLPTQVNPNQLPVNIPTGGWNKLYQNPASKTTHVPATVEEHFWGHNGQTFGVTGNYIGVSWFTTTVNIPASMRGKRITLQVQSVRFRAEIFVNEQLCGYDLVNSTPFEVDITDFVKPGYPNRIAFRITDPNGNFNWKDSQVYYWGDYRTNPSHGFGGITGKVTLRATDAVFIGDCFIKNRPVANSIDAEIQLRNNSNKAQKGHLTLSVSDQSGQTVYTATYPVDILPQKPTPVTKRITLPKAKLWSPDAPHLYTLKTEWKDAKNTDQINNRFGFRWFEVRTIKGDRQFYLNGKRIVLRTAISWGFWPVNGITPSDQLSKKQIESAKAMGLNMLTFHRTIGQEKVLDYADELGLLYWEEPGGNQYPAGDFNPADAKGKKQADFYFAYRNEKLARMIRRDRNHPSLIIYNLHNERGAFPQKQDYEELRDAHKLDETRILIYNSSNGDNPLNQPNARFKTHLMPYDTTVYDFGWWDKHNAGGPGVYHDRLYVGPDNYHRFSDHKNEIIFWGEEGAIGTPPRLQLIREEILKEKQTGWEAEDYLKWYEAYDHFLTNQGFKKAFPNVDSLTKAMGNVAMYYQGRIIENIRISNTVDGYAINGWESMKLENHSGVVDNYRNPKGDPELIARYNQPLFVSVKLNKKVLSVGDTTTADFYLVNEKDLKGSYLLRVSCKDADGNTLQIKGRPLSYTWPVKVTGGSIYGQLLHAGWKIPVTTQGYTTVEAQLLQSSQTIARGDDHIFAVQLCTSGITANGSIADSTGEIQKFLAQAGVPILPEYGGGCPSGHYLIAGAFEPQQWGSGMSDLLEWVYEGNTLIIVANAERWAEYLADKEILDYRGSKALGKAWYGGNFFVRENPFFEGLPTNCAFNWEFQCFAAYNRNRLGLRIFNGQTYVGCVSDHKKEVYSAFSQIPAGRGQIIITSLDITSCIQNIVQYSQTVDLDGMNESMRTFNNSSENKANAVGQQLLLNLCRYGSTYPLVGK